MSFFIKTPRFIKLLFKNYIWEVPNNQNKIYLTFDDGPTPKITNWVLSELEKYNAKATFFCIGDNIKKYPEIFTNIISGGHSVGNHTQHHVLGWQTANKTYFENVLQCQTEITGFENQEPKIFRPPYGKIKPSQSKFLRNLGYKIIMWDVISFDFDKTISKEECLQNVIKNTKQGSIVVFHDSEKAFENLEYCLPKFLEHCKILGYVLEKL